jgi:cytochrome P450
MHKPEVQSGNSGQEFNPDLLRSFEPFGAEYLKDPYPFMAHAREVAPAFYSAEFDYWIVTRYEDIRRIFQSPGIFSAANTLAPLTEPCPMAKAALKEGGYTPVPALVNVDPPAHTRARRLANVAFTPKRVAAMEPFIRDVTRRFCEEHLRDGRADLVGDLAWGLPALVLFRILGLPEADVARVKEGARNRGLLLFGRASEAEQVSAATELAAFWRYASALVEARTQTPADDLISALAQARDGDDEALTRQEVTAIVMIMFFAGNETTTCLMGNSFRRLLEDRPSWEAICREPELIPNAIEEVLRIESSVITWRRITKEAVEIGGVRVPAKAKLLLLLGSANRDPSVFHEPDRFDIWRANAHEHMSFGFGPHICLGNPLARLEARVVLEEVSRRLPGLQLAPDTQFEYPKNISLRGPTSLPVTW